MTCAGRLSQLLEALTEIVKINGNAWIVLNGKLRYYYYYLLLCVRLNTPARTDGRVRRSGLYTMHNTGVAKTRLGEKQKCIIITKRRCAVRGEGGEGAPVKIKYAYLYEYIVYTRGDALNVRTARV